MEARKGKGMHRGTGFHSDTGWNDTMRSSGVMLVGHWGARAWGTSGAHRIAGARGHVAESWDTNKLLKTIQTNKEVRVHCVLGGIRESLVQIRYFSTFKEPRNRCQGIDSANLCGLAGRCDNSIPNTVPSPPEIDLKFQHRMLTTNVLYRKFETNIPRNETARIRSQFPHSCICDRFLYSHDRSAYAIQLNRRIDRGNV